MRPLAAGFGERTPPGSLAVTLQHVPLGRIELPGEHVRAGEHIRLELGQDREAVRAGSHVRLAWRP
ncbi:MAG TPA: hypothetical protein VEF89_34610 [Solirubrobacteraceae bacterium]|nr:hypothetical protein [Solirubrobacteraceae bacterium]